MEKSGYNEKKLCVLCKEPRTSKGHDPCIANLPGVLYACCGHGIHNGNIKFEDGRNLVFTPLEMELNKPHHKMVKKPVPIRINGEFYSVVNFKKRKKQIKRAKYGWMDQNGWTLEEN
jgi:hypothetical protein